MVVMQYRCGERQRERRGQERVVAPRYQKPVPVPEECADKHERHNDMDVIKRLVRRLAEHGKASDTQHEQRRERDKARSVDHVAFNALDEPFGPVRVHDARERVY
jgi:hypothetical protein